MTNDPGDVMEGACDALALECPNCDSPLGILREDFYDRLREEWRAAGKRPAHLS
jgi:hypothetical protein